jgi:hypothetical protein
MALPNAARAAVAVLTLQSSQQHVPCLLLTGTPPPPHTHTHMHTSRVATIMALRYSCALLAAALLVLGVAASTNDTSQQPSSPTPTGSTGSSYNSTLSYSAGVADGWRLAKSSW